MRRLALAVAALAALAVPGSALAGTPEIRFIEFDRSAISRSLSAACGFTILFHQEGVVRVARYYDESGSLVREATTGRFKSTFTNAETGVSITSVEPFSAWTSYNEDGTFIVTVTGPRRRIVSPGSGLLGISTGRAVWLFDANGNFVEELFRSGPEGSDPLPPDPFCEALG